MSKRKGNFLPGEDQNKRSGDPSIVPAVNPNEQDKCPICLSEFTELNPPYPMGYKCANQLPNPKHKYHSRCLSQMYENMSEFDKIHKKACILCGNNRSSMDDGITDELIADVNVRAAQEAVAQAAAYAEQEAALTPEARAAAYATPEAIAERARARAAARAALVASYQPVYDERGKQVFDKAYWDFVQAKEVNELKEETLEADRLGISLSALRAIVAATEQGFILRRQDPARHWKEIQERAIEEARAQRILLRREDPARHWKEIQAAQRQAKEREELRKCPPGRSCNIMGGKFRKSKKKFRKSKKKSRKRNSPRI
jgi:hypothetical protein